MKSVFAQNLVEVRKLYGFTQEEAAGIIGIKRATLGAYEEGRAEPSHQILKKICDAYQITNLAAFLFLPYNQNAQTSKAEGSVVEEKYRMLKGKDRILADLLLGIRKS